MRNLGFAVLLTALAVPGSAQPAVTTLSVQAAGGWELICHVATSSGDLAVVLDAGRSSWAGSDFRNVSCEQTGSGRGPMVIKVNGPAVCPFKAAVAGTCEQSFPHGPGSFTVRSKRS